MLFFADRLPKSQGLTLFAGERRVLRVAAGSRCIVARGEFRLTEPARWLGERIVSLDHVLGEGAEHALEPGGWITLHALTDTALRLEAPASLASTVLGAWRIVRPSRRRLDENAVKTAAAVLLVASAVGWSAASIAQTIAATELRLTELEKSFWACDHASTTGLIDSATAITCGSLTETLKQRKFGGDFNAMLAWWRQHKEAEHLALAKAGDPSLARLTQPVPK